MMKYIDRNQIPTDKRPLGYWLRAIEGPLHQSMRDAFATFGVTRREWRALTTLKNGPATADDIRSALPRRRHGAPDRTPRTGHRTLEQLLEGFVERGWASLDRGSYALTAEGERIHDAVLGTMQKVRAGVIAGIPDADYATTMATLQKIAANVATLPGTGGPLRRRGRMHQRPSA